MLITCISFVDFKAALMAALNRGDSLFENAVRVSTERQEESEVTERVRIRLSTVVQKKEGSEYLLMGVFNCGFNYKDGGGAEGDAKASLIQEQLRSIEPKFDLLPGFIET